MYQSLCKEDGTVWHHRYCWHIQLHFASYLFPTVLAWGTYTILGTRLPARLKIVSSKIDWLFTRHLTAKVIKVRLSQILMINTILVLRFCFLECLHEIPFRIQRPCLQKRLKAGYLRYYNCTSQLTCTHEVEQIYTFHTVIYVSCSLVLWYELPFKMQAISLVADWKLTRCPSHIQFMINPTVLY